MALWGKTSEKPVVIKCNPRNSDKRTVFFHCYLD